MAGQYWSFARKYKDYIQAVAATQAGAAGTAIADMVPVPQGLVYVFERYSVWSNSSGTPIFELYTANDRNIWLANNFVLDRTRRADYTANGKNNIADNNSPVVFLEGEVPIFAWTGGSNNDICQAAIQIAVYEVMPGMLHRDQRQNMERAAVNEMEREMAEVVVGSGDWPTDPEGQNATIDRVPFLPWTTYNDEGGF